jgi:7,8-dihydroneopterin aldolase/epimerase/oxygenase
MPEPTDDLDAITLHAMSFHTLIGVLPHEREHPQPLEIDLTAWVRPGGDVVDYRKLYAEVRDVVESAALFYLEELADSVAGRILEAFSVVRVRIAIRKPHAAVGGPLGHAEVAVIRERNA